MHSALSGHDPLSQRAADKPLIYVTQPIHEAGLRELQRYHSVHLGFGERSVPIDDVLPEIQALLVRNEGVPDEIVRAATRLRVISRAGAGYENIPVQTAQLRGIPVYVTAGANARSVAEHVFALALAVSRAVPAWDTRCRMAPADLGALRETRLSRELSGRRLGLLGIGRIGLEVAKIGRYGFGMRLSAYHPTKSPADLEVESLDLTNDFAEFLRNAEVISIQVPLTQATKGLIGRSELRLMRSDAILINVSRGGVVDEPALAEALKSGGIAGAGVDVWASKVPRPDNPLIVLQEAVLTPHRAGRTEEAQERQGLLAARAIIDYLAGASPQGVVDVAHTR